MPPLYCEGERLSVDCPSQVRPDRVILNEHFAVLCPEGNEVGAEGVLGSWHDHLRKNVIDSEHYKFLGHEFVAWRAGCPMANDRLPRDLHVAPRELSFLEPFCGPVATITPGWPTAAVQVRSWFEPDFIGFVMPCDESRAPAELKQWPQWLSMDGVA